MEDTKDEVDENKLPCDRDTEISTMNDDERLARVVEVLSNKNFSTFDDENNVPVMTSEETQCPIKSSTQYTKSKIHL